MLTLSKLAFAACLLQFHPADRKDAVLYVPCELLVSVKEKGTGSHITIADDDAPYIKNYSHFMEEDVTDSMKDILNAYKACRKSS